MTASVFVGGLLLGITGSAGAVAKPTVAQVKHRLAKLETKAQRLDQQYDQVKAQLTATDQRLKLVDREVTRNSKQFNAMRQELDRIAVAAYEDGNISSTIELLVAGKPQQILNQSSILLELSDVNNAQISQFLSEAKQLTKTQELARRTQLSISQLKANLTKRKSALNKLISTQKTLLDQLTPAQQATVGPGGVPTGNAPAPPKVSSAQVQKVLDYAYAAVDDDCPYVFGGTGPCADGYDCSGLTMEAWAAAGVSIPRTSEEQWADLPHVTEADMEPGDIMVFNGAGHVGIYVGNNELIDAPHTGLDVELVSFSGWYASTFDGAVRP